MKEPEIGRLPAALQLRIVRVALAVVYFGWTVACREGVEGATAMLRYSYFTPASSLTGGIT